MIGNVWEWTADWWAKQRRLAPRAASCCGRHMANVWQGDFPNPGGFASRRVLDQ